MDGISQPAIKGFGDAPLPGQHVIDAKFALLGHDPAAPAASWLVDGSFLAFRQLEQLVPEFNDFVNKHPIAIPGLSPEKGSELLGCVPRTSGVFWTATHSGALFTERG